MNTESRLTEPRQSPTIASASPVLRRSPALTMPTMPKITARMSGTPPRIHPTNSGIGISRNPTMPRTSAATARPLVGGVATTTAGAGAWCPVHRAPSQ